MGRKLDLSAFQKNYYELTLFDGEVLHIGKPSQGLVLELLGMDSRIKELDGDNTKIIDIYNEIVLNILNNNKEGKVFKMEYIKKNFDFEIEQVFLQDYIDFVGEVQNNPN